MQKKRFGGWMFWSLDMDDFNGKFCGEGKFPLVKAVNRALGGMLATLPPTP